MLEEPRGDEPRAREVMGGLRDETEGVGEGRGGLRGAGGTMLEVPRAL